FSIKSAWDHWRSRFGKVEWHKLLWGPHRIPKVSFIVWVALHNRLYTGDRLLLFGLAPHSQCPFCLTSGESHSHLFFKCPFSHRIWSAIEVKCNIQWPDFDWPDIVTHVTNEAKGKSLRANILSNAFLCSIYHIWIERNNRVFNKEFKPEEVVIKIVIQMVRNRMLSVKNLPRSAGDSWFLDQWNLPATIMKPHILRYRRASEKRNVEWCEFLNCGPSGGKEAQVEWCESLYCGSSGVRSYIEGFPISVLYSSRLYLACWRYSLVTVPTGFTIMYKHVSGGMGWQSCHFSSACWDC
ncbi:hypothetical protein LOK49_LG14G01079, partial [Camellia lanceoleosa]